MSRYNKIVSVYNTRWRCSVQKKQLITQSRDYCESKIKWRHSKPHEKFLSGVPINKSHQEFNE